MSHLEKLGKNFEIKPLLDDNGYLGRECPDEQCKKYFLIKPGTGIKDIKICICPYCGCKEIPEKFHTKEQIKYGESVVFKQFEEALIKDLKELEFEIKPSGGFGIGLSMKVIPGDLHQIYLYKEKQLEKYIECENCKLNYAVYGIFGYCPDCGEHNSLQILSENLKICEHFLDIDFQEQQEFSIKSLDYALRDVVSSFDGFGREVFRIYKDKSVDKRIDKISFQNLEGAGTRIKNCFGLDIASFISQEQWNFLIKSFQKRHLLEHSLGIYDEEYIEKTGDNRDLIGKKMVLDKEEIKEAIKIIHVLSERIFQEFKNLV